MRKFRSRQRIYRVVRRYKNLKYLFFSVFAVAMVVFGWAVLQGNKSKPNAPETVVRPNALVEIAEQELGNSWEKYCSWWGYPQRQEWCAVFVCWCAEQAGYRADEDYIFTRGTNSDIDQPGDTGAGTGCHARFHNKQGKYCGRESGYVPESGDFIYFDWEIDNENEGPLVMDHIGIVEKVQWGRVYTIEGNRQEGEGTKDLVRRESYPLSDGRIRGYSRLQ